MPFDIENFSDRLDTECSLYAALITAKSRLCVVEINEPTNPFPVLCAIRGLTIASTLNFVIGPQLAKFVYELATKVSLEEFVTAQLDHYHQMKSSRDQIDQWIVDVRTQLEAGQDRVRLNPSAVEREL